MLLMGILFDDANSDHIQLATTAVTGTPLTLAAWVMADTVAIRQIVMALQASDQTDDDYFSMMLHSAPDLRLNVRETASSTANTATAAAADTWYHVVCVARTASVFYEIYLNGVTDGTNDSEKTPAGIDELQIGGQNQGATDRFYLSGHVAHAAVWSSVLTTGQIEFLASGGSPLVVDRANLQHYAHMEGGSLSDLITQTDFTDVNGTTVGQTVPGFVSPMRRRGRSRYRAVG